MRTTLFLSSSLSLAFVIACGGNTPAPANDPTTTTATPSTPSTASGGAMPSEPPASATGTAGGSSQVAAPTTGATGDAKCKSGEPSAAAKDLDACKADCQKLSDQVPPGSRCIPERASCMAACNQKYKK